MYSKDTSCRRNTPTEDTQKAEIQKFTGEKPRIISLGGNQAKHHPYEAMATTETTHQHKKENPLQQHEMYADFGFGDGPLGY